MVELFEWLVGTHVVFDSAFMCAVCLTNSLLKILTIPFVLIKTVESQNTGCRGLLVTFVKEILGQHVIKCHSLSFRAS